MRKAKKLNRRRWLTTTAGAIALSPSAAWCQPPAAEGSKRPRVAAVVTEFTFRSHAHVILENFLEPYYFNGVLTDPGMDVVALYVDQFPQGDMARDVARQYGFRIYSTIRDALCLGGKKLAVDGVLSIGEHGNYPFNERGQHMYPRKRFFDEITAVFRASGRSVPLFNDKHLSYRWDWAEEMARVARELEIPFLAGSSVPLAERRPPLEWAEPPVIQEAVSIHSGGLESYDFHALEVLQSLVESRQGGETGVVEIQQLEGDAVWRAADEGGWDYDLALAALRADTDQDVRDLRAFAEPGGARSPVHVILIRYRDGLRATVLRIGQSATRWKFACRVAGEAQPRATRFYVGPWENRNLFKALAHAIQTLIRERRAPYPVERTLLTTGMLAAAMDSRFEGHRPLPTPHLTFAYTPRDFRAMREMGASWKIITEDQREPAGINPGGPRPGH